MKRLAWATFVALLLAATTFGCDGGSHQGHEPDNGSDHEGHDHEGHGNDQNGENEDADGPELIRLGSTALDHANIKLGKVEKRSIVRATRLPAEVRADPDRVAHITPLVASQVTAVKVRPGDVVKKGQALATLKSVELGEARASIASAKAAVEVAQDRLDRQTQLVDAGIGAQKSYVEAQGALKRAKADLAAAVTRANVYGGAAGQGAVTVVQSPLAGTVVARHANQGEVASPDQELFVIADISRVWVISRAYERDLRTVQVGVPATITMKAFPEEQWHGKVAYVSPMLDERTRTAEVRVELDNERGLLRPGMFGIVLPESSHGDEQHEVLAVPKSAVQRDGEGWVAFVPKGEKAFERRPVTIGAAGNEFVEVLSGLKAGEQVVTTGTFILKSEAAKHEMGGGHSH